MNFLCKNTFLLSLIILLFVSAYSVSAQTYNLVDELTFDGDSFYQSRGQVDKYDSYDDNPQSDGVSDLGSHLFAGAFSTSQAVAMSGILVTNHPTMTFDEIEFSMDAQVGSPQNKNFIIDVYWCRTNLTSLTNSVGFNDCETSPVLIRNDFDLSTRWGLVSSGNLRTIGVKDTLFVSTENYILFFKYVSGTLDGVHYYTIDWDLAPLVDNFIKYEIQVANISGATSGIAEYELVQADTDMDNIEAMSDKKILCPNGENYPSCVRNVRGTGDGNGEVRLMKPSDDGYLNVRIYNGTPAGNKGSNIELNFGSGLPISAVSDYSFSYDIRVNDVEYSSLFGSSGIYGFARVLTSSNYGVGDLGVVGIGRIPNNGNVTNYTSIRIWEDTAFNYHKPDTSDCYVGDGDWHTVLVNWLIDETYNLTNTVVYVDGVECMDYTSLIPQTSTQEFMQSFFIQTHAIFDVDYDNFRYFEGIVNPDDLEEAIVDITLTCPYQYCIFNEPFAYTDNFDLSTAGWELIPESGLVKNEILYFDSNYTQRILTHDFIEHDYEVVTGLYELKFADYKTPIEMEDGAGYFIYQIGAYCDNDITVSDLTIAVLQDIDFTGSENRSIANIYDSDGRQLGTITVDRGDFFNIKRTYDTEQQKVFTSILRESDLIQGYVPEGSLFTQDFDIQCNDISGTQLTGGFFNLPDNITSSYVGFDTIYFYGEVEEEERDYTYYNDSDRINQSEVLVKTEFGDWINNLSNMFGFRSDISRFFFWLIIIFVASFAIFRENVPTSAKTIGIAIISVGLLYVGWKWSYVPNIVFIMFLFILSIVGAIIFQRIFGSSSYNG